MCEQSLNELLQYVHYIADLLFSVSILLYILERKEKLRVAFLFVGLYVFYFFFIYLFWRLDGQQNNQQIYLKIDFYDSHTMNKKSIYYGFLILVFSYIFI